MCPEAQPPGQHLEEMRIVVAAAVAARVDTLVLSSENLSLADSQRMREYATILDGHEVVLIYGLMPFHSRARSWWQELIKNGHTKPWREISAILLKTKFLRLNNLVGEVVPYWPAARIRWGLFRRFSSEGWPKILPPWVLRLPPETANLIEEHSKGVQREIEVLGGQRNVTVYGQFDGKS